MNLEMTEEERELLIELVEHEEERAIHGIDHADSRAFKDMLRLRIDLLESLKEKIRTYLPTAA